MRTANGPARTILVSLLLAGASTTALTDEKPSAIRAEMTKTEEAYFALYNKLNTDRRFDMVCRKEKATGTNFLTRVCQPRYVLDVQESRASERIRNATSVDGANAGSGNGNSPSFGYTAGIVTTADAGPLQDAFRKNMLDVLEKSPELKALGQKRDELEQRLAAATKK